MKLTRDYFKWQASVLDSEYKGSIVEKHHGDTGENRENILNRWLVMHLPKTATPEIGGKILDSKGNISKQTDLVLYNNKLPRFGAFKKSYYFAEGVCAAIEIKSRLDSSSLHEAIKNLSTVKKSELGDRIGMFIGVPGNSIPTGIFAFENGFSSVKNLLTALKNKESNYPPIDFICINKICYIVYNNGAWNKFKPDGTQIQAEKGYFLTTDDEECIWQLVLELSRLTTAVVSEHYDFQKYFISKP